MQAQLNAKSCHQIYTNHKMKYFVKFKDRTRQIKTSYYHVGNSSYGIYNQIARPVEQSGDYENRPQYYFGFDFLKNTPSLKS